MPMHRWPLVLFAVILGAAEAGWLGRAFGLVGTSQWIVFFAIMVGFPAILALLPRPWALILGCAPIAFGVIWAVSAINQPSDGEGGFMLLIFLGCIAPAIGAIVAAGAWLDRRNQRRPY